MQPLSVFPLLTLHLSPYLSLGDEGNILTALPIFSIIAWQHVLQKPGLWRPSLSTVPNSSMGSYCICKRKKKVNSYHRLQSLLVGSVSSVPLILSFTFPSPATLTVLIFLKHKRVPTSGPRCSFLDTCSSLQISAWLHASFILTSSKVSCKPTILKEASLPL